MTGDKIKIAKILNREITIHSYKIVDSIKKDNTKCLQMQIAVGNTLHVVFTGSKYLIATIQRISDHHFPIVTTITEENDKTFRFN